MAPRPTWKGFLKLSLVSCPVRLYPATSGSERISFNTLNRKTGNRVRMFYHDAETDEIVPREDQVKGYEYDRGQYVVIEPEDLEGLRLESSQTIDIERFVATDEIDPVYFDSPYYLAPDNALAEEAFSVIREAMGRRNVVGLGRLVLANRERPVALESRPPGMLVTTLRSAEEVRKADTVFEGLTERKGDEEMVSLAEEIIKRRFGPFDPELFRDRYQTALREIVEAKLTGKKIEAPVAEPTGKVIDLMAALKRSLQSEKAPAAANDSEAEPPKKGKAPAKKPAAARAGQREMLMPIKGGEPKPAAKRAAEPAPAAAKRRKAS